MLCIEKYNNKNSILYESSFKRIEINCILGGKRNSSVLKWNDSEVRKYTWRGMRLHLFHLFDRVSNVGRNAHDGGHIRYNCTANGRSRNDLYADRIDIRLAYFEAYGKTERVERSASIKSPFVVYCRGSSSVARINFKRSRRFRSH